MNTKKKVVKKVTKLIEVTYTVTDVPDSKWVIVDFTLFGYPFKKFVEKEFMPLVFQRDLTGTD